jgi:hypothetical protein
MTDKVCLKAPPGCHCASEGGETYNVDELGKVWVAVAHVTNLLLHGFQLLADPTQAEEPIPPADKKKKK